MKPQRIAIIHDKQQYGEGLARSVRDGLKNGGANVVFFDAPRDKCAHFLEINGIAAAFQYLQKHYNPAALFLF